MSIAALNDFQEAVAPRKPLRVHHGMDVRVGAYVAPPGGPAIGRALKRIAAKANAGADAWQTHIEFEKLHPYLDGNGRTGRALWAWQMRGQGRSPFVISFLHRFYYLTLAHFSASPKPPRARRSPANRHAPSSPQGESQ
jgi:hypothetical protein